MFEPVAESKIRQGTHVCIFPCFSLFSFQGPNFCAFDFSSARGRHSISLFQRVKLFYRFFSLRFHSFEERNQPAPSRRQVKDSTRNHAGVKRFFRIIFIIYVFPSEKLLALNCLTLRNDLSFACRSPFGCLFRHLTARFHLPIVVTALLDAVGCLGELGVDGQ